MPFANRTDAGRRLAERLSHLRGGDVVVLGLPRGGVPVAFEVATGLGAPLDVIVVRKLGVPFQPELAMGAVGEDGVTVLTPDVAWRAGLDEADVAAVERRERAELERRVTAFRGGRPRLDLAGKTALIVDDGAATGSTANAACQIARSLGASKVVLAVPVCSPDAARKLRKQVDELVCVETPPSFSAVGQWYRDFPQVSDRVVVDLLRRAAGASPRPAPVPVVSTHSDDPSLRDEELVVPAGSVRLAGHLTVPERPTGLVVFAHGSGSSRHSPRNLYVARLLNEAGLATVLFDLLTRREEGNRRFVFDIELLAQRLAAVSASACTEPECRRLPLGYFGASTGAAAALCAAAAPDVDVAAVVSRGGRPDLADRCLAEVRAPTLLIVGGRDEVVLDLNARARALMHCPSRLAIVPGATHLFDEPGTLEQAAALARDWFVERFAAAARLARSG